MNVMMWLLMGAAVSWLAWSVLHLNGGRGAVASLAIGALGAFAGGHLVTPLLGGQVIPSGDFHPLALMIAGTTAIVALMAADMIYERFGF